MNSDLYTVNKTQLARFLTASKGSMIKQITVCRKVHLISTYTLDKKVGIKEFLQ